MALASIVQPVEPQISEQIAHDCSVFEEMDAHYISVANHGYAVCWLEREERQTKPDLIKLRIFDKKGWPLDDVIKVAKASSQNYADQQVGFSDINFPVIKSIDSGHFVVAWAEDLQTIFMQIIHRKGILLGEKIELRAFDNYAHSRSGIDMALAHVFPSGQSRFLC